MKKAFLLLAFFFVSLAQAEAAPSITATGGWTSATIDASDLISGAGSDIGDEESATNATVLKVTKCTGLNWRIDVKRVDNTWNSNIILYVQRTSDGIGPGTVSGGTSYIPVDTTNTQFFSGSENNDQIAIQYKLSSSVSVPPNTYKTTVSFTIVQQ